MADKRERKGKLPTAERKPAPEKGSTTASAVRGSGGGDGGGGDRQEVPEGRDSTAAAAELLLRELQKGREVESTQSPKLEEPKMEEISAIEMGALTGLDEAEMDKQSRAVQERLEKRRAELKKQAVALDRMREELKSLEAPMKQEILKIREKIEELNRNESRCVGSVNDLRKALFAAETEMAEIRKAKSEWSEKLIVQMAEYETKKKEKLQRIEELFEAGGDGDRTTATPPRPRPPQKITFGGF